MKFPRISTDSDVMGGQPCIRGLRMPVATILDTLADGVSVEDMLDEHPDLTREDIREAVRYAAEFVRTGQLP